MTQFIADCEKLQKVITSCKTKDQLRSALFYYKLWENKMYRSKDIVGHTGMWVDGFVTGYFRGRLEDLPEIEL